MSRRPLSASMCRNADAEGRGAVAGSGGEGPVPDPVVVWPALVKTLHHFFPQFRGWLAGLPDPRDPRFIVYPISYVILSGLLLFLTKLGARRQIRFHFTTAHFIGNVNRLAGTSCETMLHPDTLAYLAQRLPESGLEGLRRKMVYALVRQKVFAKARLLARYHLVVIDGTGHLTFRTRHCAHCLTRTHGDVVLYYHPVLEAKLVTPSGLAISIATEFIENAQAGSDKQDCERKAFLRLSLRLKRDFPQLPLCLLLDSLYACGPVFDRCRACDWRFIITFKEGSAPAVFAEYERLKAAGGTRHHRATNDVTQDYTWVNGIDFSGHAVDILECVERVATLAPKRFVWVTDIPVNEANFIDLERGGRQRWRIENEGFNIQKNNGYELEHAYCEHERGARNFYLLLQIAHLIAQLLEKGLLAKTLPKEIGAIKNVARFLLEELRRTQMSATEIAALLARPIQVRLNDSS